MTKFHVEIQVVFYRKYEVEAANREQAEALAVDKEGLLISYEGVSTLLTNTHEVRTGYCSTHCLPKATEQPK